MAEVVVETVMGVVKIVGLCCQWWYLLVVILA